MRPPPPLDQWTSGPQSRLNQKKFWAFPHSLCCRLVLGWWSAWLASGGFMANLSKKKWVNTVIFKVSFGWAEFSTYSNSVALS